MPRKSIGSIEGHGPGWRAVYWRNGKRVRSPLLPTREAAEEALQQVRAAVAADPEIGQKPTLRTWGAAWLERRAGRSQKEDGSRWRRHLETAPFALDPLADLDRRTIKRWVEQLARRRALEQQEGGEQAAGKDRLSAQTVRHILNLLRRCLADALDEGLIATNPAAGLRLDVAEHQRTREWAHLTAAEIAQLLAHPMDAAQRAVYAVAIYAGLRQGELIALRWEDVHLGERPHLTVRRSHGGPTKNERQRMVPLLEPAAVALRMWRAETGGQAEVWPAPRGGRRARGDDFGWSTKRRGKQRPQPGLRELVGIRPAVVFHDLRHTCASHLVMGTWGRAWRLDEVRDFLGHSDVAVTQRYAHLSPEYLHAAAAATPGGVAPQNRPTESEENQNHRRWALQDSNLRPLASEANLNARTDKDLGAVWGGTWGGIEAEAALTVLQRAAAGQDLPAATLELLGVDAADPLAARRAIERAREVLQRAWTEERDCMQAHRR